MMETQTCAGLVSALEGRAAFYDVVAALYYKPLAQEQIDRIAEGGLAAFAGYNLGKECKSTPKSWRR